MLSAAHYVTHFSVIVVAVVGFVLDVIKSRRLAFSFTVDDSRVGVMSVVARFDVDEALPWSLLFMRDLQKWATALVLELELEFERLLDVPDVVRDKLNSLALEVDCDW